MLKKTFNKIFGRSESVEKKAGNVEIKASAANFPPLYSVDPESFLYWALSGGMRVTSQQAMEWYRQNSSVATAVDMIADAYVQIKPVIKSGDEFITDHPVLDLLKQPNGQETYREFAKKLSVHYLLKHDSYILGFGNINRPPIELYAAKPILVMPQEATDGYALSYMVSDKIGRGNYMREERARQITRYLDGSLKELYHIMGFSSRSVDIQADSPLEAAALETKQQIQGRIHNLGLLNNGGRPSLIIAFKEEGLDIAELKRRKEAIQESLGGSENAGKIATISGTEVDIKEAGINNKDMDYSKLDQSASNAIYLRYKIPLPLISTDAAKFKNFENAIALLYEGAILPHADIIFSGLTKFLMPRFGLDPTKEQITYDPLSIDALKQKRLDELKQRKDINVETTDELRESIGKDEVDGGNVIYQNASLIPIGTDIVEEDERTPEEIAQEMIDKT